MPPHFVHIFAHRSATHVVDKQCNKNSCAEQKDSSEKLPFEADPVVLFCSLGH